MQGDLEISQFAVADCNVNDLKHDQCFFSRSTWYINEDMYLFWLPITFDLSHQMVSTDLGYRLARFEPLARAVRVDRELVHSCIAGRPIAMNQPLRDTLRGEISHRYKSRISFPYPDSNLNHHFGICKTDPKSVSRGNFTGSPYSCSLVS